MQNSHEERNLSHDGSKFQKCTAYETLYLDLICRTFYGIMVCLIQYRED